MSVANSLRTDPGPLEAGVRPPSDCPAPAPHPAVAPPAVQALAQKLLAMRQAIESAGTSSALRVEPPSPSVP